MNVLVRPVLALCTIMLLGMTVPGMARTPTLSTADPQVCCSGTDAAGNQIFFLAPRSQCPRNKVVAMERCKEQADGPVCCRTPNGPVMVGSSRRCRAAGGTVVPNRYCRKPPQEVCCRLRNGTHSMLPADRCKRARGTPVNVRYCRQVDRRVCCKTRRGYSWESSRKCRRPHGTPVNARYCQQTDRRVCCKTRKGYTWAPASKCRRPYGAPVNARYCQQTDRRVCCRTRKGFVWTPAGKCRQPYGTPIHERYCRGQTSDRICCKYPKADGSAGFGMMDPKRCRSLRGSQVPNRYCLRPGTTPKLRRNR